MSAPSPTPQRYFRFIQRVQADDKEPPSVWLTSSQFSADTETYPGGIGTMPSHAAFEMRPDDQGGVWGRFQPTEQEVESHKDMGSFPIVGEVVNGAIINEDDILGSSPVDAINVAVPGLGLFATKGKKLPGNSPMRLDDKVPCTWRSGQPDGYIEHNGVPLAVFERKGKTLQEATAQCIAYSEQIANNLLRLGLAVDRIVVPTISYTGNLVQIGATFMLPPSFSIHAPVSRVIDLALPENHALVRAILCRVKLQVDRLKQALDAPGLTMVQVVQQQLSASNVWDVKSRDPFYVKWMSTETLMKGYDLLDLPKPNENANRLLRDDQLVANGIAHEFRVFNQLYAHFGARPYVVFPTATVSRGAECIDSEGRTLDTNLPAGLVFPNLYYGSHPYRMGVPRAPDDLEAFIKSLRAAVEAFGDAQVAHLDLYPCNIFYRKRPDDDLEMDIKIIDWDLSHRTAEGLIPKQMKRSTGDRWLKNAMKKNNGRITVEYDRHYLGLYEKLREADGTIRDELASDDANRVNRAFREHANSVASLEGLTQLAINDPSMSSEEDEDEEEDED